jgi:peptide/nickel transport system ATP-binding protein
MTSHDTILTVNDLSISFQSGGHITEAVRHLTFSVRAGKTLAIVGESGSGKSVSSLSIMQLLPLKKTHFASGHFAVSAALLTRGADKNKITLSPDDLELSRLRGLGVAMIFQEPMTSLNPVLTCGEQVGEMLTTHLGFSRNEMRAKVISLFQEVKLPRPEQIYSQYPHQLSGGQRQRVMIAMAISCGPKILIADEPTTALDVTVQKDILILLKSLCADRNMGMIFITHDLGVVEEIADDLLVMCRGEAVEYAEAKKVLGQPQHAYTRGLLACRPLPEKKAFRLLTVTDVLDHDMVHPTLRPDLGAHPSFNTSERPIVSVKNLSKEYSVTKGLLHRETHLVRAVDNVSFEVFKGETLGLVGESGCGKTTLSRMLLGLIPSSNGKIQFMLDSADKPLDISEISPLQMRLLRKEIQIIFQDPYSSLNPRLSILRAITEPMQVFGILENDHQRKLRAAELMQKVGLREEHLYRYPHEFSGGQRQRVVIARALACEPKFIICDESVSALDVSVQAQVLNLLNDLKKEFGLTYLFISHDLNVVYYMSDRILVMNKGRIEEIGTADEVFKKPQSGYTIRLLGSVPGLSASGLA